MVDRNGAAIVIGGLFLAPVLAAVFVVYPKLDHSTVAAFGLTTCRNSQTRMQYHVDKGNIFGSCLILVGVLTLFLLGKRRTAPLVP